MDVDALDAILNYECLSQIHLPIAQTFKFEEIDKIAVGD